MLQLLSLKHFGSPLPNWRKKWCEFSMRTQRNTWKPWHREEIWQRSFHVPVRPRENDVLYVVSIFKVISMHSSWSGHCSCTTENLSWATQTAPTLVLSQQDCGVWTQVPLLHKPMAWVSPSTRPFQSFQSFQWVTISERPNTYFRETLFPTLEIQSWEPMQRLRMDQRPFLVPIADRLRDV